MEKIKRETVRLISSEPKSVGVFQLTSKEYCQYLYLPIKMAGSFNIVIEPRLRFLTNMVAEVIAQESQRTSLFSLCEKYIYLTIKQTFIAKEAHHNRPGWHSDGFGTYDVQYIWFDKFPTEFMIGEFNVSSDDTESMADFQRYSENMVLNNRGFRLPGPGSYFHQPDPFHLYFIDQNNIHRTTPATEDGVRTFIKITVSSHIYAQEGNSVNYDLDYSWDLAPRYIDRNQPHAKN